MRLVPLLLALVLASATPAHAGAAAHLLDCVRESSHRLLERRPSTDPEIIGDNVQANMLRLQLLAAAKPSDPAFAVTFTFEDSYSARSQAKLLGDEAERRRGVPGAVPVQFVVDGHFANPRTHPKEWEILQWMANRGVEVYVFNPLPHRKRNFFTRRALNLLWINHRKLFGVGDNLIISGRNMGAHYLEYFRNEHGFNFVDADIVLRDRGVPALSDDVSSLVQQMIQGKNSRRLEPDPDYPFKWVAASGTKIAPDMPGAVHLARPVIDEIPVTGPALTHTKGWTLLKSGWKAGKDQFRMDLHASIQAEPSGGRIEFETPYFYPDARTRGLIDAAIARGVKFDLLTNSVKTLDGPSKLIAVFMDQYYQSLIARGATIRFTTEHMVHAKTYRFRRQGRMYLGSHNVHTRSGTFDKETMVRFDVDEQAFLADVAADKVHPLDQREIAWNQFNEKVHGPGAPMRVLEPYRPVLQHVMEMIKNWSKQSTESQNWLIRTFGGVLERLTRNVDPTSEELTLIERSVKATLEGGSKVLKKPVGPFL